MRRPSGKIELSEIGLPMARPPIDGGASALLSVLWMISSVLQEELPRPFERA
jgi:hypothetical protein